MPWPFPPPGEDFWYRSPLVTVPAALAAYWPADKGYSAYLANPRFSQAMPADWFTRYETRLRSVGAADPLTVMLQMMQGTPSPQPMVHLDPALEAQFHRGAPWMEQLRQRAEQIVQDTYRRAGNQQLAASRLRISGLSLPNTALLENTPIMLPYPEQVTGQPPTWTIYMSGRRHPGMVAHELGHVIDLARLRPWQKRLLTYSAAAVQANPMWFMLASALAPDPLTATAPALAYAATTFPTLAAEWRASSLGNELIRSVTPHLRRYRAGIGLPHYMAAWALPLAGMGLNWLAGDKYRLLNWSDTPVASSLVTAGALGLMGRDLLIRPLATSWLSAGLRPGQPISPAAAGRGALASMGKTLLGARLQPPAWTRYVQRMTPWLAKLPTAMLGTGVALGLANRLSRSS